MIATDGVFSMDGDVAPLKEICDLADRYSALVFIDECHATGILFHLVVTAKLLRSDEFRRSANVKLFMSSKTEKMKRQD